MNFGERILGAIVPTVVDAVPVENVVAKVDVDRLVGDVDVDALVQRVDVDAMVQRVDVDALVQRVDLDALLARVDLQTLTDRLDVDAFLEKVDIQALLERVDIDALAERIDVAALAKRAGIDDIVAEATRGAGTRILTLARRQLVALDLILAHVVSRLTHRPRPEPPTTASPTGLLAGGITRLAAFLIDFGVVTALYGVLVWVSNFMLDLFTDGDINISAGSRVSGAGFAGLFLAFGLFYMLIGLQISGNSIGMALVGLRVLRVDGSAMRNRHALARVVVFPFSFLFFGLGLVPIALARSHRALHDKAAGTNVLYDWGDGPDEDRSPLSRWIRAKEPDDWPATTTGPRHGLSSRSQASR